MEAMAKSTAILIIPMLAGNILWFLVTKNNAGNGTPSIMKFMLPLARDLL
jgi:hypothetical protein